jgi:hypothetical protein
MTRSAVFSNVSARPPGHKGRRREKTAAPRQPLARKAALANRQTAPSAATGPPKGHGSIGRTPRHGRLIRVNQP